MLVLIISFLAISLSCMWLGFLLTAGKYKHPVVHTINGLTGFTLIAQAFALFLPVNFFLWIGITSALITTAFIKRNLWKNFIHYLKNAFAEIAFTDKVLTGVLWLTIILIGAGPVMMDDTESYHIQLIKWIQEYGSVPGLVNLHERYGFNSSWFSSVALFGFSSASFNVYTVLNLTISCWFCYYLVSRMSNPNPLSWRFPFLFVLIAALLVWPMIRGNAATANYDFITTVVVCILFMEFFLSKDETPPAIKPEWLIWPVYLFSVRVINFPLLLISFIAIAAYLQTKQIKKIIYPFLFCFLLIIPFLARNVIVSGYLFFPAPYVDLFSVDWKPPHETIEQLLYYIKYYNRVSTAYLDLQQTEALGETGWVGNWFRYLFTYDKLIVIAGVTGLISGFLFFKKRNTLISSRTFIAILLAQLLAWFMISPDPRFVYGCLLCGVFLLPFVFQKLILLKITSGLQKIIPVFFILLISGYAVKKIINEPEYRNWILPKELSQPQAKEYLLNGITLRIPEIINNNWNPRCIGTALPCVYEIHPALLPRGKSIKEGFRIKK